jgi:hypothetical protein
MNRVYSRPYSNEYDEDEYVKWHISLYENKEIDIMFTGFGGVYTELKKLGYPVFRLEATIYSIKNCYKFIKQRHKFNIARNSQIAVSILKLIDYKNEKEKYYSDMLKMADIDKKVVEYAREINGSIFKFGRREYVVFLNKGAAQNSNNYRLLYDLKKEKKLMGFILCAGIGLGHTAYQAELNAYNSLKRSELSKNNEVFIIDEKENVIGPLKSEKELHYSIISKDKHILEISKKTGVSFEYIAKIISINKLKQNKIYDSKELADYLNISERSANRIIKKLVSSDYARIYAKKSNANIGRPRVVFEMQF